MGEQRTIAIVGGGFSGSLTAFHLVRRSVRARVVVIEPRHALGLGLAYSTPSREHLLNVPAGMISALPDDPGHFVQWLRSCYDPYACATDFAPRAVFGEYVQSLMATAPQIEHLHTIALDCHHSLGRWNLDLADATVLRADTVVLSTGHFDAALLWTLSKNAEESGGCHSAWEEATYADLKANAPVTLIGTGLTAVDVVLRLRETGHRGIISAISRHGRFPESHAREIVEPYPFSGCPPATAAALLGHVHRSIRKGIPWRAVVDGMRERTNELWLSLSAVEQRRFHRHLQRRWDVVRHRMAPRIADAVAAELAAGTLKKYRGSLHAVLADGGRVRVQFKRRDGEIDELISERVINCTGPNLNYGRAGSPLLDSLFKQGLILEGPHGRGLWSGLRGELRARGGGYSPQLFNVGPGRQGILIESIAIPELRQQAVDLAELLYAQVCPENSPKAASAEATVFKE